MAEAAHLTETASGRPTLFELIAVDGLFTSLHPAVQHICKMIVTRYPRTQFWLDQHFDELFLLANAFVQRHYLFTYAGSLAENFYGIKRTPLGDSGQDPRLKLSALKVYRSLLWLSGFPYIKTKLDKLFEDLEHEHAGGLTYQQGWRSRAHKLFLRLYPVLHAAYSFSIVLCYMAYMFERADHHSPLTWLSGVRLETLTGGDWQLIQERHAKLASWSRLRRLGWPAAVTLFSLHTTSRLLRHAMEVGSFFIQFLESWNSAGDRSARRLGQTEVPPPPAAQLAEVDGSGERRCPLCDKRRESEAVLAVSGHVFCHVCIFRYVSEEGRCPVTWYPATTDQIYKLYPPDS
ncbi:peroxisome assembly protein 12-like [Pollicipes pollicipes]|uniref:peroxisome assembly protein 12-like n=1 Tax=Pollicipes pollicipes TaxID=41117 RepID=UPI001884B681|nr:peroxisome assembly protein 12-like [Pollicipes pollicipes]XP_037091458.1 peroxisome assembly protein 12-like [Pollicipes pollicipes]XP_037091459.1 peroxisome assembly protein 12-like [Pollicipes pollicipes]XP_037091460.1 peroxisome assembly protein 12-like [Pollicipes pollicipes]